MAPPVVLVGAGDIADCNVEADAVATGKLIAAQGPDAIVVTLGDNAYDNGTTADFRECYDPAWGAFAARTHPAAGNHDWNTPDAAGYRAYFEAAVGSTGAGGATWYAFDAGAWRVIVLDANCWNVGGCDPASPQGKWLAAELASETPGTCQLAIWHQPVASSGLHGDTPTSLPLWRAVFDGDADLVLDGHDHHYERFAKLGRDAQPAAGGTPGTREIIVGTGGAVLYPSSGQRAGSEANIPGRHGIIRLELSLTGYRWQFLATPDGTALDEGSDTCR